jgi:ribosome biogenesis GTPase
MKGQIFKIFSDFYYVKTEAGTIECKLRQVLKKKKQDIIVGDYVELESITDDKKQAFIKSVAKRNNFLSHPKVANVSQAIIVSSLKNPDLDFEQLNRYIALCEYHKITPILCFNKFDLIEEIDLSEEIKNIYEPLNYKVFFTSALYDGGIDILSDFLKGGTSILCGASGVGKSSIVNVLSKELNLTTKSVSEKTQRGVHTTRHCEIYELSKDTAVVDTPGFSNAKFNFLLPQNVQKLFPEINRLNFCKYKDCTHIQENDCNVKNNLTQIAKSRYESYVKFVEEAKEYKKKITFSGNKIETFSKTNKGIELTKISERKRALSRKVLNQTIKQDEE